MFALLYAAIASLPFSLAASDSGLRCVVKPLGGGQDDGPNILTAFSQCSSGGTVVLDKYYVVDTLLMTTGLKNVDIELSGTSTSSNNVLKM